MLGIRKRFKYLKIPIDTMTKENKATRQINLKVPENLYRIAKRYSEKHGFRNIQDLAAASMREKIFEKREFDETFSEKEIELIDAVIEESLKKKKVISEEELLKVLRG